MASNSNSNQSSTSGFGSETSGSSASTPSLPSTVFEENEAAAAPTPAPLKGKAIGAKRAANVAAAQKAAATAAAAALPKAPNASSLPAPPNELLKSVAAPKPAKATSRKNKKKGTNNSSNNVGSVEAVLTNEYPGRRKVRTNNGETVNTSVGSNAFESSDESSVPEANRVSANRPVPNRNNRGLSDYPIPTFDEEDKGAADLTAADIPSETESPEVANASAQPITPMVDTSMYLLLRVGNDSSSEYIELRKQPIATMGSFNTHTLGSTKEIQNLYGIRTSEGYKAMQRAFGIPKYGKKAPFDDYIYVKKCKFVGFDLVRDALLQRIRTLEESIRLSTQGTINSNRNKHFVDVLKKMVDSMSSVKKVCAAESKPAAAVATVATMTNTPKPFAAAKGCPCLEDLTLLRDLVYLVAMIQGTAIPEVKKQLESIPLSKLLNAAAKPEEKRTVIQKALEALKTITAAEKVVGTNAEIGTEGVGTANAGIGTESLVNDDHIQSLLKLLWKVLTQEDRTDTVTKEEVIERIQALLQSVKDYETAKAECDTMGAELDDLRKRYMALQEILGTVEENSSADDPFKELQRLLQEIRDIDNQLAASRAEVDSLKQALGQKNTELATLSAQSTQNNANAAAEKARLDAEIGVLRGSLAEAEAENFTLESQNRALLAGLESLKRQIDGLKTELSEADAKLSSTITKDLQHILDLQTQLEKCQKEKQELLTAGSNKNKKAEAVAKQIEEKDEQITELQKQLAEAVAEVRRSAAEIESLRGQLAAEKGVSSARKEKIDTLARNLAEADISFGDLQKEFRTLQAQIATLEAEHSKALDGCAAREAELQGLLTAEKGNVAGLEAAMASLSAALQEAEVAAARANAAEANSAQLKVQLGESAAKIAAEEEAAKAAKAAHEAQMETISTSLAGARAALAELEGKIGDAKTKTDTQERELDELRTRITSLETELDAKGKSGTAAEAEFQKAKEALEAEAASLRAALGEAQEEVDSIPAIDQARQAAVDAQKAAEDKVAALQQQLSTLEAEKQARETNLTAAAVKKNSNMKLKEDEYKAEVDRLTRELGEAEAAAAQAKADAAKAQASFESSSAQKNANLSVKNGQIATLTANRNARLREIEELQKQVAEVESLKEVSASKNAAIAAKNSEIASLQASLTAAQAASSESITTKDSELADIKAQLAAAKEALASAIESEKAAHQKEVNELQEKLTATELERDAAQEAGEKAIKERGETAEANISAAKAAQQAIIADLQQQIEDLNNTLKTAITNEKDQTKTRLNTLLSMIVINDDMKEKAVQWWDSGDNKETLEKMSSELLEELCEFFQYLANVINLQMVKITTSLKKIREDFVNDIFTSFKEPAIGYSDVGLRRDITILFQELFVQVGNTTTIGRPFTIDKELPELHKALQYALEDYGGNRNTQPNEPIALPPSKLSEFAAELGSFGFLSDVGVVPIAGNKITIRKQKNSNEFTRENTDHYTPLVILGIKYIQLLNKALNEKYSMLKARCAKA